MNRTALWLATLTAALLAGCSPQPPPDPQAGQAFVELPPDAASRIVADGKSIAAQAFQALSAQLKKAIEEGGVVSAVPYCSTVAFPLTSAIGDTNGVQLRRISHKPRNPAAAANPAELHLISQYQDQLKAGQPLAPAAFGLTNGNAVFYGPIVITNELCLKCHGRPDQELAMDVLVAIRQKFPSDTAIDFKLGDLRGLWRIEFPAPPPRP